MEKLFSRILGTPVLQDGLRPITSVKDVVVDPENGKVIAFVVNINQNKIITPIDVVEWKGDFLKVHPGEVIIDGHEVLRVERVQKAGIRIERNRVVSKDGMFLGRVYDFSVDTNAMALKNLYVAKDILGLLRYEKKIIEWKEILEITAKKIVVKSGMQKIEVEEKMPEFRTPEVA